MAHYLVEAKIQQNKLENLRDALADKKFNSLQPFGRALSFSLSHARCKSENILTWEEEDYCNPPLAQERAAVLDKYFSEINIQKVPKGKGWEKIESLSPAFPDLHDEV